MNNDGIALRLVVHTKPVWYKRLYNRIRYFIFPPKFSKDAIEIAVSDRIDYCGACDIEHGYKCPRDGFYG